MKWSASAPGIVRQISGAINLSRDRDGADRFDDAAIA
jgi:hypothetical protein